MDRWYERPLDQRAKPGGETGLNGKFYRGGELMPFYVPRPEMPQIGPNDLSDFLGFLERIPIEVERKVLEASALHPHQKVNKARIAGIVSNPSILNSPCLVSSDLYILDGNHRWWAHVETRTPVPVIVIGAPFEQAIGLLFDYPKTYVTLD